MHALFFPRRAAGSAERREVFGARKFREAKSLTFEGMSDCGLAGYEDRRRKRAVSVSLPSDGEGGRVPKGSQTNHRSADRLACETFLEHVVLFCLCDP